MRIKFELQRAKDYPPELHKATDAYERAVNALPNASDVQASWARIDATKRRYGRLLLALDRQRRPDVYA